VKDPCWAANVILQQLIFNGLILFSDFCEYHGDQKRSKCKTALDRSLSSRICKQKKKLQMLHMKSLTAQLYTTDNNQL
jgi:hypothetical protein